MCVYLKRGREVCGGGEGKDVDGDDDGEMRRKIKG